MDDVPFSHLWRRRLPSLPRKRASRRFRLSRRIGSLRGLRDDLASSWASRGMDRVMPARRMGSSAMRGAAWRGTDTAGACCSGGGTEE